jgi:hypothetical protein
MLSSGLVVRNQGFGTIPSTYQQHEDYLIRPSIPLEPAPKANQVQRIGKRKATEMLFPTLQYEYLFPKFDYNIDRQRTIVGKSEPFIGPLNRDTRFPPSPSSPQSKEISAEQPVEQPTQQVTKMSESAPQLSVANKALGLAGAAGAGTMAILNYLKNFSTSTPLTLLGAAVLPPELFNFLTETSRRLQDEQLRSRRIFDDAITIPATQAGAQAILRQVDNVLFSDNGVLGPGWVRDLTRLVQDPRTMTSLAGEGSANAIRTMLGPNAQINVPNLVTLFSRLAAYTMYRNLPGNWLGSLYNLLFSGGAPGVQMLQNLA